MGLNHYSEILNYIKEIAEGDIYINTITQGAQRLDLNKANIFPLLNIEITSAGFPSEGTLQFSLIVSCLSIRDINKEVMSDKFNLQDNEIDNLNETLAALSRIWKIARRGFINNNISASDNPSLDPIIFDDKNLLDGWSMSFDIEMPNTELDLCKVIDRC